MPIFCISGSTSERSMHTARRFLKGLWLPRVPKKRFGALPALHALWIACFIVSGAFSLQAQWLEGQFDDSDMAQDLEEALTFRKYPTYPQYLDMMQGFARDYPAICRLDTFGTSTEGRLLLALKITDNPGQEEPEAKFLYTSTMHGDELAGYILLLRLAHHLLEGYGTDNEVTYLVDSLEIWINPLANPDGSYSNDQDLSLFRSIRNNVNGVNLNRDFPDPALSQPDDTTGRERETREMMEFLHRYRFTLSANLHSGAEVVNYPWDHTFDLHADDAWYRFVSREYADEARAVDPDYMFGWPDEGITNGAKWYIIYGGRQDYMNYYLEGREVTLELSNVKKLESDLLEDHWQINRRSLLNYMAQCTYGIRGQVTDAETGKPLRALITLPGHDESYSTVHSSELHGDFYRLIKEGTYELIASAPGYLNDTLSAVPVTDYRATWLPVRLQPQETTGLPSDPLPEFRIWPNPVNNRLNIKSNLPVGQGLCLTLVHSSGRIVWQKDLKMDKSFIQIPMKQLDNGLYLLQIRGSDSAGKSFRILKIDE